MQQLQATRCPPGMVNLALKFRLAEAEALLKHERWVSGNLQDQVDSLQVQIGGACEAANSSASWMSHGESCWPCLAV